MKIHSYKSAGVDIEKGDRFTRFISSIKSKAVSGTIGGFAGGIELDLKKYKKPVLFSSTDGVGTKLIVASQMNKFDTIGIDLVAMCVNDLAVCGAMPLVFLDYIACGKLNRTILENVMKGIVTGCEIAQCKLAGGETAEMPDMYKKDDFDLAGFCVGLAEKSAVLPKMEKIKQGDIILGLPSAGIHANGLSLARKVIPEKNTKLMNELLVPTQIYVREMQILLQTGKILAAAHITGGGLKNNLIRVLPPNLIPRFTFNWSIPEIFITIQENGDIPDDEMKKVFNMGIGIALIVKKEHEEPVKLLFRNKGMEIITIGVLENG